MIFLAAIREDVRSGDDVSLTCCFVFQEIIQHVLGKFHLVYRWQSRLFDLAVHYQIVVFLGAERILIKPNINQELPVDVFRVLGEILLDNAAGDHLRFK